MDQDRLALREAPAREDVVVDGVVGFRQATRLQQRERLRHGQAERFVGHRIFGIAAADHQRADRLADAVGGDAIADRDDPAGNLETGNLRRTGGGG